MWFRWTATYSYHEFLSTPSIVDLWEMRGKAVNSRNVNILADSSRFSTRLSTEITSGIWPRQIALAIFSFLEGHSPDLQRCFLDTFDGNKPTAETENNDFRIGHLCFIPAHNPPVLPHCIRPHE